jgi:predicted esterase YcpF (UPF0227 family)
MVNMSKLLVYIHGFLSSPLSQKAVEVGEYLVQQQRAIDYQVPQLSNYPDQAYRQLQQLITGAQARYQQIALIGSSMGGFYATCLAEQFGLKAVVVNPAVYPYRLIADYLGTHENPYTHEHFTLTDQHVLALQAMAVERLSRPENCWLMAQQGDETLDYREAVAFYQGSPQLIETNGNHRFENFKKHLPALMKFLELVPLTMGSDPRV